MYIIILTLLTFFVLYIVVFALASKIPSVFRTELQPEAHKILFLIPAYKEDAVIIETVKNLQGQLGMYQTDEICVVADHCQAQTIEKLKKMGVWVEELALKKSTKAKAINQVLGQTKRTFDMVVLLDADNHLVQGFVDQIRFLDLTQRPVYQAHRMAKNLDSPMAILDAISEETNNAVFRKGHAHLGLSAALIGSGLVIKFSLFKKLMAQIDVISGFDKQLELELIKAGHKIHYLPTAHVLDEKVRNAEVFKNQRTRWLLAQWNFAIKNVFRLKTYSSIDLIDKVFQFILPPRIFLLAVLVLNLLVALVLGQFQVYSLLLLLTLVFSLVISTPNYLRKMCQIEHLIYLFKSLWAMTLALTQMKKAKDNFIHTPHAI